MGWSKVSRRSSKLLQEYKRTLGNSRATSKGCVRTGVHVGGAQGAGKEDFEGTDLGVV